MNESREIGHKGNTAKKITVKLWGKGVYEKNESGSENTQYFIRHQGQFIYSKLDFLNSAFGVIPEPLEGYETTADVPAFDCDGINPYFMFYKAIQKNFYSKNGMIADGSRKAKRIHANTFLEMPIMIPSINEQNEIVKYLKMLDHLITLHQRKLKLQFFSLCLMIIYSVSVFLGVIFMGFAKEVDFEAAMIEALSRHGWEHEVLRYPTEDELIDNWARILFENNRDIDRLNDCPLIREEMDERVAFSFGYKQLYQWQDSSYYTKESSRYLALWQGSQPKNLR